MVAVQNPLTSLADDVAGTKRVIALQDGRVILVGHSYAGVVITEAGTDPKVAGLVHVAAFAPGGRRIIIPSASRIRLLRWAASCSSTVKVFSQRLEEALPKSWRRISRTRSSRLNIGQTAAAVFGATVTTAAWKTKPSWTPGNDRAIRRTSRKRKQRP